MTDGNRRLAVVAGIAALVGAGAFVLWLNRPGPTRGGADASRVARLLAADLESTAPVQINPDAASEISAFFVESPAGPPPGLPEQLPPSLRLFEPTSDEKKALADMLAQWITLLHKAEGDAYAAWMRARGYEPRDEPQIWDRSQRVLEALEGVPLPEGIDAARRFELVFEAVLKAENGDMRPIALSTAEYGRRLRFLESQGIEGYMAEVFFYTQAEMERWIGFSVAGWFSHWKPPVSMSDVQDAHGYVPTVFASFAYESATGKWRPTNVVCYLDPATGDWHFRKASTVNAPSIAANVHY